MAEGLRLVATALAIALTALPLAGQDLSPEIIPDSALRAALLETLESAELPRTVPGLARLREFSAVERGISRLVGLELAIGLEALVLDFNQIEDLSAVRTMRGLRFLNAAGNRITDLTPIAELDGLRGIWVGSNRLTSLEPIRSLDSLQVLVAPHNQIADLDPARRLGQLRQVNLEANPIEELGDLSEWRSVRQLMLGGTELSDITSLSDLTALEWLDLRRNRLVDVSILRTLRSLQRAFLSENRLTEVPRSPSITWLILDHNPISTWEGLEGLPGLKDLQIDRSQAEDGEAWLNRLEEGSVTITIDGPDPRNVFATPPSEVSRASGS